MLCIIFILIYVISKVGGPSNDSESSNELILESLDKIAAAAIAPAAAPAPQVRLDLVLEGKEDHHIDVLRALDIKILTEGGKECLHEWNHKSHVN